MDNFEKAITELSAKKENYTSSFQSAQTEYSELEEKRKTKFKELEDAIKDSKLQKVCLDQILNADQEIKDNNRNFKRSIPNLWFKSLVIGLSIAGVTSVSQVFFFELKNIFIPLITLVASTPITFLVNYIVEKVKLNRKNKNLENSKKHHVEQHTRYLKSLGKLRDIERDLTDIEILSESKKQEIKNLEQALILIANIISNLTQRRTEIIEAYIKVQGETYLNNAYATEYGFDVPQAAELLKLERKINNDNKTKRNL